MGAYDQWRIELRKAREEAKPVEKQEEPKPKFKIMTMNQAAEMAGCTRSMIFRMAKAGTIKSAFKLDGKWLIEQGRFEEELKDPTILPRTKYKAAMRAKESGQTLVETALVLGLFLAIVMFLFEGSYYLYNMSILNSALADGTRMMSTGFIDVRTGYAARQAHRVSMTKNTVRHRAEALGFGGEVKSVDLITEDGMKNAGNPGEWVKVSVTGHINSFWKPGGHTHTTTQWTRNESFQVVNEA